MANLDKGINQAGLQQIWTRITTLLAGKANTSHTHTTSDVTGLDAALGNKANTSDVYTKTQVDTLIDNVNHAKILNLGTVNGGLVEATEATVTEVCNQYVQTNYSRSPADKDSIIVTLTDKSNDKVMYMYMNESWVDISRNAADVASATEDTAGITKLYNAISAATDGAVTPAAVNTALAGKAPISHTHEIADVTGLQDALDSKADASDVTSLQGTVSALQTTVAGKANSTDVYKKTETYSKAEVDGLIPQAMTTEEIAEIIGA